MSGVTWEVIIDLIHLQDYIVGNTSLGQQHIQLARHTTCYRVDTKPAHTKSQVIL